ncbi:MAG: redox-regulated ATPase YchF [Gammaproteobacteria bacterium]
MGFKCGLVGMPNVGKSSIFNLLTSQKIDAKNFPFCTIDPNVATVEVPDERLDKLSELNSSKSKVNAVIEFVDIAGLIKGASKGEGLGNDFLTHIRNTDAIAHVVRFFVDDDIIHVNGQPNPTSDFDDINSELILSDISTLENLTKRVTKSKSSEKEKSSLLEEVDTAIEILNDNKFLNSNNLKKVKEAFPDIKMLTQKPMFVIANINEDTNKEDIELFKNNLPNNIVLVDMNVKIETDLNDLSKEEKVEFMKEFNISESALSKIIKTGYSLLDLKTFFTSGEKESRAWAAKKYFNAYECSGIIHTDIQKGFIRAETVSYDDYIISGSEQASKANGVWRQEGKDYVVNEGDVIYFRFNV